MQMLLCLEEDEAPNGTADMDEEGAFAGGSVICDRYLTWQFVTSVLTAGKFSTLITQHGDHCMKL